MNAFVESLLIFFVRSFKLKKIYSLAWRYSQSLVEQQPKQLRTARTVQNFLIQGELDDYLFRSIYFTGRYEEEIVRILKKIVRKDQVWFDLGSNIGFFSLYLAQNCKQVLSVDANPAMVDLLKKTQDLNDFKNMIILNNAVSDVSHRTVEFYVSEKDLGRSSMLRYDDIKEVKKITASTIIVDDIVENYKIYPFGIKIDIEGVELDALRGSSQLFKEHPPKVLVMELSQREEVKAQPDEIIRFLKDFQYTPYIIRGEELMKIGSSAELDRDLDPNAIFVHQSFDLKSFRNSFA